MQKYNSEIETPVNPNLHQIDPAVKIPLDHALISGLIVSGGIAILGLIWGWLYWPEIAGTVGVITIIGMWVYGLRDWRMDKRPYVIGSNPDPQSARVLVHVRHQTTKENGHVQINEYDLPGSPEALRTLARAYLGGMKLDERGWAGPNKPFSSTEWRNLVDIGINKKGLFAWKNPENKRLGWEVTEKGRELFEELADNDMDEFIDD